MGEGSAIAVVGLSCRLPGASDPAAFWDLLRLGSHAISELPDDRRSADSIDVTHTPGASYGGFLKEVDRFNCAFFGISPREAAMMDPQQRLMLELCWEALEDAAVTPGDLRCSQTGVFVGSIASDYESLVQQHGLHALTRYSMTGLYRSLIANRVSYTLGLRGPSMTVDTGQSSSLVAVHLACESLVRGESALALACGVHLNLSPMGLVTASSFGGLSPDARCFTFDARANGYVRGEGGGVVVLKPLFEALDAGDFIYGVIRGSAVNNDGGGDGLTAPSQLGQEELLRHTCSRSGVEYDEIQYVELHGTATRLGDRVEAAALGAVLGGDRPHDRPLIVGSVKTNIGHLEGAAGIVGLIKAALCLQHREIPPSLNFSAPSSDLPLDALGLQVQQTLGSWPREQETLYAGVSSFGIGGTNCHVVLGEPPATPAATPVREREESSDTEVAAGGLLGEGASAWLISGRDDAALRAQAEQLARHLEQHGELAIADIARTLIMGRQAHPRRAVVLGGDRGMLLSGLQALAEGEPAANAIEDLASPDVGGGVVFIFPGQGSQWEGMALELMETSWVFADSMRACGEALGEYVDWSLLEVLASAEEAPGLDRIDVVQPALFAVMVSLARLWRASGVHPTAVVGHSQGEIAAAHVAGVLSLRDAARIVALRSRLLTALVGHGSVLSVTAPTEWVAERLERWGGRVAIGGINGSGSSVGVVGERQALTEFLGECEAQGVRAREVPATVASHSPQVEPLRERLLDALVGIAPRSAAVPFYSTVSGGVIDGAELDPGYWYRNMREPVRFEQALREMHAAGLRAFIEVSSHPVLAVGLQQTIQEWDEQPRTFDEPEDTMAVGTLRRGEGGAADFTRSLAEAWVQGASVDWETVLGVSGARRVKLPTYAFQRRRHWFDQVAETGNEHGLLDIQTPLGGEVHSGSDEELVPAVDGSVQAGPRDLPENELRDVAVGEESSEQGVPARELAGQSLLRRRLAGAPVAEHRRLVLEAGAYAGRDRRG